MENIIIVLIYIVFIFLIKFILGIKINDVKKIKEIGYNKELAKITDKLPPNKQICKEILKKLENENVKIEETESKEASLYIVATNTILISDIKDTFMRVQTIAHECLHSIQNKKILLFNFIYSNIYIIYFLAVLILTIFGKIKHTALQINILIILGFIYYIIRSYLETDAMIKAEYLAKEYMEETDKLTKEEIEIIKYVGGSDNFIRMPFIVEGFTIGFIGSTIALFICIYMYEYILENINNAINFMNNNMMIPVSEIAIFLAFVLFITGITIGVLGSIISVKRHLKV